MKLIKFFAVFLLFGMMTFIMSCENNLPALPDNVVEDSITTPVDPNAPTEEALNAGDGSQPTIAPEDEDRVSNTFRGSANYQNTMVTVLIQFIGSTAHYTITNQNGGTTSFSGSLVSSRIFNSASTQIGTLNGSTPDREITGTLNQNGFTNLAYTVTEATE